MQEPNPAKDVFVVGQMRFACTATIDALAVEVDVVREAHVVGL